jgi:hypothetical protein
MVLLRALLVGSLLPLAVGSSQGDEAIPGNFF